MKQSSQYPRNRSRLAMQILMVLILFMGCDEPNESPEREVDVKLENSLTRDHETAQDKLRKILPKCSPGEYRYDSWDDRDKECSNVAAVELESSDRSTDMGLYATIRIDYVQLGFPILHVNNETSSQWFEFIPTIHAVSRETFFFDFIGQPGPLPAQEDIRGWKKPGHASYPLNLFRTRDGKSFNFQTMKLSSISFTARRNRDDPDSAVLSVMQPGRVVVLD